MAATPAAARARIASLLAARLRRSIVLGVAFGLAAVLFLRFIAGVSPVHEHSLWPALQGESDFVLVSKLAREPARWEIWVYEPDGGPRAGERRIKRVLGLPGEHIDFRGGDVWIGTTRPPAERAPRPARIVDRMLVPLHPGVELPDPAAFNVGPGTLERDGEGRLVLDGGRGTARAALKGSPARAAESIQDDYWTGAGGWRAGEHAVADVRVDVVIDAIEPSYVTTLRIRHELQGGEHRTVAYSVAEGLSVFASSGDGEVLIGSAAHAFPEFPISFRMETIDGRFRVALLDDDGAETKVVVDAARDTLRYGEYSALSLRVDGGSATLRRLDARRDVYYFWPAELEAVLKGAECVRSGTFYLVGDNVPVSEDSRKHGPVRSDDLLGRAVAVVWPLGRIRGLP